MTFRLYNTLLDVTAILAFVLVAYFVMYSQRVGESTLMILPDSFKQLNTIFLSLIIEAIPFVLIGVLIAGCIQIFVTEEHVKRWIPENKYRAIMMGCLVGAVFPACECGIVPIVRRLVAKGVPLHAGIGFLLTGPLINPIVILSTFMAFGNDIRMAGLRMGVGFIAALLISLFISSFFRSNQLKHTVSGLYGSENTSTGDVSFMDKLKGMCVHSIDEFFDMGKYLIIGAFVAAFVQTYVQAQLLFLFGEGMMGATGVMMGLAFFLSLCSEADAFIGASFSSLFPPTAVLAFLIYGPMIDLKNTIMLLSVFKSKFVFILLLTITVVVFVCTITISLVGR
ncbi:permease [Halobacillus halophilus]|uniref:permease n=1 Tax=Halobacillus halophilus TaxID=1570 RepID=UPI001369579B|nr:permease [Halobacillus halophilus]MYL29893.1 permease [Halobacillus halophilus]